MANRRQQKRRYERARTEAAARRSPEDRETRGAREPKKPARGATRAGGRRVPPTPSYSRAAKRAFVFAALWFIVLSFTPIGGSQAPVVNAVQASMFFFVLAPVGYFTELLAYRRWQRRNGEDDGQRAR
jgi:hypothetical protein